MFTYDATWNQGLGYMFMYMFTMYQINSYIKASNADLFEKIKEWHEDQKQ